MRRAAILFFVLISFAQRLVADCTAGVSAQWDEANNYFITNSYYGANTSGSCGGTEIWTSWDGGPWHFILGGTGYSVVSETFTSGHACWFEGQHTINVRVDCQKPVAGSCVPDTSAYASTGFVVHHGVTLDSATAGRPRYDSYNALVVDIQAKVSWKDAGPGSVHVWASQEMTKTLSTLFVNDGAVDSAGNTSFVAGFNPARPFVKIRAVACDKTDFAIIGVTDNSCSCPSCGDCQGGPIRMSDGNMRYSDTDPLPAAGGLPLARTYDSRNGDNGWFGHGWTSFLDEWLRTEGEPDGSTTVAIGTDGGDRYFFNGSGGTYRQLWPIGPAQARLDSGFVLRPYGSNLAHYFDANGRMYKLRDVTNGREVNVWYDANGLVTRVADSWGNWAWTVTTDSVNHRITNIAVDGTPVFWTYVYDGSGNLTNVRESGADWRTYTYSGSLTQIHDAAGNLIESHAYGTDGATSSIGQTDDISSVTYTITTGDPATTITRVTSATGAVTDYYIKSIAGRMRTDHIEGGCTSCTSRNAIYAYDDHGRLLREQDARGYITERSYDTLNRIVSETTALKPSGCDPDTASDHCRQIGSLGTVTLAATPASVTRAITYDATWYDRPASITTASVLSSSGSRIESITYDPSSGQVLTDAVSGWTGSASSPVQETHTTTTALYNGTEGAAFTPGGAFDASWLTLPQPVGMRKSIDGPRADVTDVTTFVYYPVDNNVPAAWRGHLAAVRNAAGHITHYENYDAFGNAQRTVDPNGVATESTSDHLGRPLTSTLKAVNGCDTNVDPFCATDLTTSRTYSPAPGPLSSQTDANGNATTYTYDARGRLATMSRGPSASDLKERIEYTYDSATGRKSLERYLAMQSGSWAEKRRESYSYDTLSQLIAQTHADNASIGYAYDDGGLLSSVRDEDHTVANTTYQYDPARRLSAVHQTLGSSSIATFYAYDIAGNLTGVTDPNGNVTTYVYDDFGRMLTQTSPVTGTTSYGYDAAGNLTSTTEANGATTTRTYDALGRGLGAVSTRDAESEEVGWTYDDGTFGNNGIGRLASMSDPDSAETFAYERRGLLRMQTSVIWGDSFVQSYGYDAVGNRNLIGYPSGRLVTYSFDFAGRQLTATGLMDGSQTEYVTSASYLPFGPLTSLSLGNGATETRTYDARYRPLTAQLIAAGAPLANYSYAADPAGNITQITDVADPTYNRSFTYDDLNRLVTANTGASLWGSGSYSYDAMGNMTSATLGSRARSFTFSGTTPRIDNATDNGVEEGTVTHVNYDAVGNELNGPATPIVSETRSYSPRNLPREIILTSRYCLGPRPFEGCHAWGQNVETLTNAFDARGVRVAMSQSDSALLNLWRWPYYFYTPELLPLNTVSPSYGTQSEEIWFAGRPVADENLDWSSTRLTFTDDLGTPLLQTDLTAAVTWRAEYEPYGNVYAMRTGARGDQSLRFPGQQVVFVNAENDEESYNIHRWYRSGWGRYTTADPVGLQGGMNLFAYAGDTPTVAADPYGLAYRYCKLYPPKSRSYPRLPAGDEPRYVDFIELPDLDSWGSDYSRLAVITKRRCTWRCYCESPGASCERIPCKDSKTGRCRLDHGVEVVREYFDKNGVLPCEAYTSKIVPLGVCGDDK